jgi:hypothetical protein
MNRIHNLGLTENRKVKENSVISLSNTKNFAKAKEKLHRKVKS